MSYQIPFSNTQLDKAMTTEQFNQIVEAILAGKYSWACVLILRFAGYNPLHYIPYRTYNRLIKDNYQLGRKNKENINPANESISQVKAAQKSSQKISDLSYLETANEPYSKVHGGNRSLWELDPFLSVSSFGF